MMLDHGADAGIAQHRGAQHAQAEARCAATFDETQRGSGREEASRGSGAQRQAHRQRLARLWPVAQDVEQAQLHAGEQDLRIDEACADIEQVVSRGAGQSGA